MYYREDSLDMVLLIFEEGVDWISRDGNESVVLSFTLEVTLLLATNGTTLGC